MTKRTISFFVALIMLVSLSNFLFTAASADDQVVTLKVWHAKTDPDMQAYFQAYEQLNPNIKIEQTAFVDDEYKTQARVALAGGETPDVWYMNTGASLEQFISANGMLDITQYIEEYKWNETYDAASLDWCTVDGKLYGLPWSGYTPWHVVWANVDFFKENNLEYPVTLDDYIALAPILRDMGQEPLVFYNKDGWMGAILFGEFVNQLTDATWIDEMNNGTRKWTDDVVTRTAMEAIKKLADANVFLTGFDTLRQDTALPVWAAEKSPLMWNGTWFTQVIGSEFDFEVQALRFPSITDNPPYAYQNALDWCLGICPNTEHTKEALEFITYAAGYDMHLMEGSKNQNLTPIPATNEMIDLPYFFKQEPIIEQMNKPKTAYFCYAFAMPVVNELQSQIRLLATGQTTIDDALKAIQAVQDQN